MRNALCVTVGIALMVAACGPSARDSSTSTTLDAPSVTTTTTSTQPATTPVGATADDQDPFELRWEHDIPYHSDLEGDWTMDAFIPDADGPWPLVVVYHGMGTQPSISEAREIASRGAVAVAPRWLKIVPPEMTRDDYIDGSLFDRAACAVSAAQSMADDFGADPANTTVSGFSAGVHPAGWVGLGVVRNDLCAIPLAHRPVNLVLGDSQLIFFEAGWDESFADPASPAVDTTERFVDPERWDLSDDLAVYLWTSDVRYGREIVRSPTADSWLGARDTTGSLLEDLRELGAFEDEWIDFRDNGELMEMRMRTHGIDVVHEAVGGSHRYGERVFDAIEELVNRGR